MKSLKTILLLVSLILAYSFPTAAEENAEPWHPAKVKTLAVRSPDSWHVRNPVAFHGSTFGKNVFVAVGEGGTIVTSPDGRKWTLRQSGMEEALDAVAFGKDGQFWWRSVISYRISRIEPDSRPSELAAQVKRETNAQAE